MEGAVLDRRKDAKKVPLADGEATNKARWRKAQWFPILMKLMTVLLLIAGGCCFHSFCLLHRLVKMHLAVGHLQSVTTNLFEVNKVLINFHLPCSIPSPDSCTSSSARAYLGMKILMLNIYVQYVPFHICYRRN